jgi:PIN domain nuclease of toxin-antitoxin system
VIAVFDSSALIAHAKSKLGADVVQTMLADGTNVRLVHAINLCEVYYHYLKLWAPEQADFVLQAFEQTGLLTRDDLSPSFWKAVARVKAYVQRVSLGDCCAIALAQVVGGTVITADRAEFDPVHARGICPVTFIR